MIEKKFVEQSKKEFQIEEFISETLKNAGHSHTRLLRTPLGDKVVIYTSRPGLIVGRGGQTISKLTEVLRKRFSLENPQVEISEIENANLDARIVAEKIASALEKYGVNRFKGVMHKAIEDVLAAGAQGVEIRLSGKLPSARAKGWRVYGGNLRKCGDAALKAVDRAIFTAQLKAGVIGIKVRIMPPGVVMPDDVKIIGPGEQKEALPIAAADAATVAAEPETKAQEKEEAEQAKPKTPRAKRKKAKGKETKENETTKETEETGEKQGDDSAVDSAAANEA